MEQIGIYLTDASFDKKTKVSSISFIEKETNTTSNIQKNNIPNIFEAEYFGIKQCLIHAFKRFKNIIVVCDNKMAIFKAQKELRREMKLNSRFNSVQFLWLPREYLTQADFLTKNVDISQNKKLKVDSIESGVNGSVFNTFVSADDLINLLKDRVIQFNKENLYLNKSKLKILNNVFSGKLIDPTKFSEEIKSDILYIINENPKEGLKNSNLSKIIELLYLV